MLSFFSSRPQRARGALERLYAYWLISTTLLLLVVVVLSVLTRGLLHRQAQAIDDLARRVSVLEEVTGGLPAAEKIPPAATQEAVVPPPARTGRIAEAPPAPAAPGARRAGVPPPTPAAAPASEPPREEALAALVDEILCPDPATPADVADAERATAVLDAATEHAPSAKWSAGLWSRLAVLALLLGRDAQAQSFADRAAAAGDRLTTYHEVAVRALLVRGDAERAVPLATALLETGDDLPTHRVLLAGALLATGDFSSADGLVGVVPAPGALHTFDLLLLGRVLMALEHWEALDQVVSAVRDVPAALSAEYSFLRAVAWARSGRTVEALAVLDGLAAETVPAEVGTTSWFWLPVEPERYEVEVWRGVALMYAHQSATARETLRQAAEMNPERGEAQFYLGQLEARAGRVELALVHLKNALAADDRLAPAWEALGALELDAGQVQPALEHLGRALEINGRRASAHFLTALAHAKLGRADAAAAALRKTFALDPGYLEEATLAEVLLKLFSVAELEALASPAMPEPNGPPDEHRGADTPGA